MVQTKKFEQSFINEYLAWSLHDHDVERRGIETGRKEGRKEANTETARRLLAMGLAVESVAQATGLEPDYVKQLAQQSM